MNQSANKHKLGRDGEHLEKNEVWPSGSNGAIRKSGLCSSEVPKNPTVNIEGPEKRIDAHKPKMLGSKQHWKQSNQLKPKNQKWQSHCECTAYLAEMNSLKARVLKLEDTVQDLKKKSTEVNETSSGNGAKPPIEKSGLKPSPAPEEPMVNIRGQERLTNGWDPKLLLSEQNQMQSSISKHEKQKILTECSNCKAYLIEINSYKVKNQQLYKQFMQTKKIRDLRERELNEKDKRLQEQSKELKEMMQECTRLEKKLSAEWALRKSLGSSNTQTPAETLQDALQDSKENGMVLQEKDKELEVMGKEHQEKMQECTRLANEPSAERTVGKSLGGNTQTLAEALLDAVHELKEKGKEQREKMQECMQLKKEPIAEQTVGKSLGGNTQTPAQTLLDAVQDLKGNGKELHRKVRELQEKMQECTRLEKELNAEWALGKSLGSNTQTPEETLQDTVREFKKKGEELQKKGKDLEEKSKELQEKMKECSKLEQELSAEQGLGKVLGGNTQTLAETLQEEAVRKLKEKGKELQEKGNKLQETGNKLQEKSKELEEKMQECTRLEKEVSAEQALGQSLGGKTQTPAEALQDAARDLNEEDEELGGNVQESLRLAKALSLKQALKKFVDGNQQTPAETLQETYRSTQSNMTVESLDFRGDDLTGARKKILKSLEKRCKVLAHVDPTPETSGLPGDMEKREKSTRWSEESDSSYQKNHHINGWSGAEQSLRRSKLDASMVIREVRGGLFSVPPDVSLAHCVAEDLGMWKGVEADFRLRFRKVGQLLEQRRGVGETAILGNGDRYVYYMITQSHSMAKPLMQDVGRALEGMRDHAVKFGVTKLAMPKIGSEIDWRKVRLAIQNTFNQTGIEITVHHIEPDDSLPTLKENAYVTHVQYPLVNVDNFTGLVFFGSADGTIEETSLVMKYVSSLQEFGKEPRKVGDVVRIVPSKGDILYGLVVKERSSDRLSYIHLEECLNLLRKLALKDRYKYVGVEAFLDGEDTLTTDKVVNLLKNSIKQSPKDQMSIYVCWPKHLGKYHTFKDK